jgi:hypothetical protein
MSDQFQISQSILQILGGMADPASLKQAIISLSNQTQSALNTLSTQPQTPGGAAGGDLSGTYPNPTVAKITNPLSQYGGLPLVANGFGAIVAGTNLLNQSANISSTLLYSVPGNGAGMYRVSCYAVETTADAASSTLPNVGVGWTDSDSGVALLAGTVTSTNTANAAGAFAQGLQIIYAKAGTNITYQTSNYASSTAGAMKYALRIRLEYMG